MKKHKDTYGKGKTSERPAIAFLLKKFPGKYLIPTPEIRRQIRRLYSGEFKDVSNKARPYDLVSAKHVAKGIVQKGIILYDVKATSLTREKSLKKGFVGLGFTLTENEKILAENLGSKNYRLLFVDNKTENCWSGSWDQVKRKSKIYTTYSVFVNSRMKLEVYLK